LKRPNAFFHLPTKDRLALQNGPQKEEANEALVLVRLNIDQYLTSLKRLFSI